MKKWLQIEEDVWTGGLPGPKIYILEQSVEERSKTDEETTWATFGEEAHRSELQMPEKCISALWKAKTA